MINRLKEGFVSLRSPSSLNVYDNTPGSDTRQKRQSSAIGLVLYYLRPKHRSSTIESGASSSRRSEVRYAWYCMERVYKSSPGRRASGRRHYWKHLSYYRVRGVVRSTKEKVHRRIFNTSLHYTPEFAARRKSRRLATRYNISENEFLDMLIEQGGKCAICQSPYEGRENKRLHVDHNHATGKVRGLLCGFCNRALGWAKDDAKRLEAMLSYIRMHS